MEREEDIPVSMYHLLFGMNPAADALLGCLGLTRDDFGRFRDVWLKDGEI